MVNEDVEKVTSVIKSLGYTYSVANNPAPMGRQVQVANNKVIVTDTVVFTATIVTETDI